MKINHCIVNVKQYHAAARKKGKQLSFKGQPITVEETTPDSFDGIDIVLSSAGGSVSKKFLPEAVKRGAVCVDNTSAFRMEPDVPLVVPEVNEEALKNHHGIIANPNCSTIQMVVALEPIRQAFGLNQIIVSTYQAELFVLLYMNHFQSTYELLHSILHQMYQLHR